MQADCEWLADVAVLREAPVGAHGVNDGEELWLGEARAGSWSQCRRVSAHGARQGLRTT